MPGRRIVRPGVDDDLVEAEASKQLAPRRVRFGRFGRLAAIATGLAGGALLGLGFLTKMWLSVPYALAACAW